MGRLRSDSGPAAPIPERRAAVGGVRLPSALALQRTIGNGATAAILQRAAAGQPVLARNPKDGQDTQRHDEVARGDRVHDDAMEFLEGKLKALYSALPLQERAKLRASGGEDVVAIGMVVDADDHEAKRPRLVYTTAGNRASKQLQAAAEKLGLTRWDVEPNIKTEPDKPGKPGKPAREQPAERKPPRVHGPNDGPPALTGGVEHAEQLMVLEAENEGVNIRGLVVSRALCRDCPIELRNHSEGRITISVVLDDAPDAPKLPNARDERWKRKQGSGSERDPGDEDDGEARRRRRAQPETVEPPEVTNAPTKAPVDAPVEAATAATKAPVEAPEAEGIASRQASAAATELLEFESSTKRLEFITESLHLALGVWQIVGLVEQFAAAGQMATSTLAHGSPYWQAIDSAQAEVTKAKDVAEYYKSLDLRSAMPSRDTDPLDWDSPDVLYQKQIEFLLVEAHIYAARRSIEGAIDELRDRHRALKEGIEERERALAQPYTSVVYAEAFLYADAGNKINSMIEDAITAYAEAKNYAFGADRFTEAAMETIEVRLRALGEQGIFHAIDTDDLRGAKLDDFNQRSL